MPNPAFHETSTGHGYGALAIVAVTGWRGVDVGQRACLWGGTGNTYPRVTG